MTDMEEQLDRLGATKQPLKRTETKRNLSMSGKKKFFEYPPVGFHRMQINLLQPDILHLSLNTICSFVPINRAFS